LDQTVLLYANLRPYASNSTYNFRMSVASSLARVASVAVATCIIAIPTFAQSISEPAPAFESASVKPAPADAPMEGLGWMISLGRQTPPHGLLTMTGPLPPLIIFAYGVDDEVEARAMRARLPEWARNQKFTIVARPPENAPTTEQIRQMLRTLLEDRFALKAHRASHTGTVNELIVIKPGTTGPGLKTHDPSQACLQRGTAQPEQSATNTAPPFCGLDLQSSGGIFHVRMVDVTIPEACTLFGGLAGVLGGRGMDIVIDATGLKGKWDIALDFLPERDGPPTDSASDLSAPSFTAALEKQLGLRLKKGAGQIEDLILDQITQPTPD
jgi:uncharacterized protein (TIGR03435 family)